MPTKLSDLAPGIPILSRVDPATLQAVEQHAEHVKYFDGEEIFRKNEIADKLLILLEGSVYISDGGHSIVHCQAPQIIGERGFFDNARRSATVAAEGPVEALVLRQPAVELLIRDEHFVRELLRVLSSRLYHETNRRITRGMEEHLRGNRRCTARACVERGELDRCESCDGGVMHRTAAYNENGALRYELLCDNQGCRKKTSEPV